MRSDAVCSASALTAALLCAAPALGAEAPDLDELLERIASSSGVEAHFVERKELSLLVVPLESRGVVYFVPPDRFARFTTSPGFSSLVVDADATRYREGRAGEELDLSSSPVARAFVDNFIALWSGDRTQLERLYALRLRVDGARWELSLTPRSATVSRVIAAIALRGDVGGMREMEISERDGDRTLTAFERVSPDRVFDAEEPERIFARGEPLDAALAER